MRAAPIIWLAAVSAASLAILSAAHSGECYGDLITRVTPSEIDLEAKGKGYQVTEGSTRGWRVGDSVSVCATTIENTMRQRNGQAVHVK